MVNACLALAVLLLVTLLVPLAISALPAVFKLLRDRHYKGWAVLDMDGPRKGDDGFEAIGGTWISPSMVTSPTTLII